MVSGKQDAARIVGQGHSFARGIDGTAHDGVCHRSLRGFCTKIIILYGYAPRIAGNTQQSCRIDGTTIHFRIVRSDIVCVVPGNQYRAIVIQHDRAGSHVNRCSICSSTGAYVIRKSHLAAITAGRETRGCTTCSVHRCAIRTQRAGSCCVAGEYYVPFIVVYVNNR